MTLPLCPLFNEVVTGICKTLPPICPTDEYDSVDTLPKITELFKETGQLHVPADHSDKTIYGDPLINFQFRAWHDYYHIKEQLEFDQKGEHQVMLLQQKQLVEYMQQRAYEKNAIDMCVALLDCEVDGQDRYFYQNGEYPLDQHQFVKEQMSRQGYNF